MVSDITIVGNCNAWFITNYVTEIFRKFISVVRYDLCISQSFIWPRTFYLSFSWTKSESVQYFIIEEIVGLKCFIQEDPRCKNVCVNDPIQGQRHGIKWIVTLEKEVIVSIIACKGKVIENKRQHNYTGL